MRPLPELIWAKEWKVEDSPFASVNLGDKVKTMHAPYANDVDSYAIRLHEYAHVKWSPVKKPKTFSYMPLIDAIEDYRVNALLKLRGFGDDLLKKKLVLSPSGDKKLDALRYIASVHFNCDVIERNGLIPNGDVRNHIEKVLQDYGRFIESFKKFTLTVAEILYPLFKDKDKGKSKGKGKGIPKKMEYGEKELAKLLANATLIPLTNYNSRRVKKSNKATDIGMSITRPERLLIDKRIFTRKKGGEAINILMDCSGSMSICLEDIEPVVKNNYNTRIALYGAVDKDRGHIVVVAEKGNIVKDLLAAYHKCCSLNVVDYQALQWLGAQKGKKYWVSDGKVTGKGEGTQEVYISACFGLQEAYGIERIEKPEDMFKMLKSKGGR